MVRSYRGALARGWTEGTIYAYWDGLAGSVDTFMVDPSKQAESLFEVARLVEAI